MSTYDRSKQLYYWKNRTKILKKRKEYDKKYHAEYYRLHKEYIKLKNAKYREAQRIKKAQECVDI